MDIVTIIGDSLAMSRIDDGLTEKDIYAYKIQEHFGGRLYVVNRSKRANSTTVADQAEDFLDTIKGAQSAFFIIHLGIVDCSPRLFSENVRKAIALFMDLPVLRSIASAYIRIKASNRLAATRRKKITATPLPAFRDNVLSIIDKIRRTNPVQRIAIVNIAYPGAYLTERSFGILDNIVAYNRELASIAAAREDIADLIDVFSFTQQHREYIIQRDGHHVTREVHDFIAREFIRRTAAGAAR